MNILVACFVTFSILHFNAVASGIASYSCNLTNSITLHSSCGIVIFPQFLSETEIAGLFDLTDRAGWVDGRSAGKAGVTVGGFDVANYDILDGLLDESALSTTIEDRITEVDPTTLALSLKLHQGWG